jgi:Glycosyl transferase family 2
MLAILKAFSLALIVLSLIPFATFTFNEIFIRISQRDVMSMTYASRLQSNYSHDFVALCAIVLNEEPYLQEWVDYNLGLGFDLVYIFDNSESHDLNQWQTQQTSNVRVTHLPGSSMQTQAYRQCAKTLIEEGKHKWAAFFDVDEFLVLRRHESLKPFLHEFLISGALAINWIYMGTNNKTIYEPMPVSYRFQHRVGSSTNMHIKTIAVLKNINLGGKFHCHFLPLKKGYRMLDTNRRRVKGPFNRGGPEDVAALYHFFSKSNKEFLLKRIRGRADTVKYDSSYYATLNESLKGWMAGNLKDNSVWKTLIENVPKYTLYEKIDKKH